MQLFCRVISKKVVMLAAVLYTQSVLIRFTMFTIYLLISAKHTVEIIIIGNLAGVKSIN